MKNNHKLRVPLIKSAVLLAVFCLLVYLTSTSPEGSVWNSLGAILYGVFKAVQFGIGLALGLIICLIVLIGIFLGSVALVSKDSAAKMYNHLRQMVVDRLLFLKGLVKKDDQKKTATSLHELGAAMQTEISSALAVPMKDINERHDRLASSLAIFHSRLEQFEQNDNRWTPVDRFEQLAKEVAVSGETVEEIRNTVQTLHGRLQEIKSVDRIAEIVVRIEALEAVDRESASTLKNLAGQIESLRAGLAELQDVTTKALTIEKPDMSPAQDDTAHRFLSYFENPEDRKKIEGLMAATLKKDMTYAQVIDYFLQESGDEVSGVIAAHPSLVKDYIRQCRKAM